MSKVLFVKANNRPAEQSVSVKLYDAFLHSYKETHPQDDITILDLFEEKPAYYDNTTIMGLFKSSKGMELTPEEQAAAETAGRYMDQFLAADKVVFAFPLWNSTVPAVLHTYFDYLCQAGKTFRYTAEGPVGLVTGTKVAILNARGGDYSQGPAAASEMAVNLVLNNLALFGVTDITTVITEGHNQYPDRSQQIIEDGVRRAAEAGASF
ncbi:FMN-dependent NADH-azoreductase 3 [Paenibacillus sp. J31TS4]|uniref:FMN-dependent NADH-azoreductase n=1 Tax=Paenibacillus sp. J31TS4 TaxID=2807195 RepID=UPI001B21E6C3|nr:FMN-dependent NADH-azoreductase [Paenibacillus sp. J31TS4]GIP39376.1 FMN-dependent NADH-azoreductase 3 [Paenibacillus sp. J31TS4]